MTNRLPPAAPPHAPRLPSPVYGGGWREAPGGGCNESRETVLAKGSAAAGRRGTERPPQPSVAAPVTADDKAEMKMPGAALTGGNGSAGPVTSVEVTAGVSRKGGGFARRTLDAATRVGFSGPNGGRDEMSDETSEDDDATLLAAYAAVNERLYDLLVQLIDEALVPHPDDVDIPTINRFAALLNHFALQAEFDPTSAADNIRGIGTWDHERAQATTAEILGNTLGDLRDHLTLRGAK